MKYAFHMMRLFFFFVLACCLSGQSAQGEEVDQNVQAAFGALQTAWSHVKSFEYKLVSQSRMTDESKWRTNYGKTDRDSMRRDFSLSFKGPNFRWETETTLADGVKERVGRGSVYDGILMVLFSGEETIGATASTPKFMADTSVAEYNPLTDAFSFLTSDKWDFNISPVITIEELQSPSLWKGAVRRISSVKQEVVDSKPCLKIDFRLSGKRRMTVTFSKELGYAPIKWEVYGSLGGIISKISVSESSEATLPGLKGLFVPRRLEMKTYMEAEPPVLANVRHLECSDVSFNAIKDDDVFLIDPVAASLIYDRDHDKWLAVPK